MGNNNVEARRSYRQYIQKMHEQDPEAWPIINRRAISPNGLKREHSSIVKTLNERLKIREEEKKKTRIVKEKL